MKAFGPRVAHGAFKEGSRPPQNGADLLLTDQLILRFIIAREWKLDSICKEIYSHLEWREINIPLPILNPQTLNCLKAGALYIHGRCKDLTPILVANMGVVGRLFE